jgi:hypothetical protein
VFTGAWSVLRRVSFEQVPRKSGCSPLNLLKYCEDRLTPSHVRVEFMTVSE